MIQSAIRYNNLGVDILSRNLEETNPDGPRDFLRRTIDRDETSGKASAKRMKYSNVENVRMYNKAQENTERLVNNALACFQKALSLIVKSTDRHHFYGSGLKYHPYDDDGYIKYEDTAVAEQLVGSINPCETQIHLEGEDGCSNSYIHCNAIKIGGGTDIIGDHGDVQTNGDCERRSESTSFRKDECEIGLRHGRRKQILTSGGYDSPSKSIFHSMICIYNIALCYQYKGVTMKEKAKHIEKIRNETKFSSEASSSIEFDASVASAEFFLQASVDHYTRAYEIMKRFRLESGPQYTLFMATMNNLAATYQSLEQSYKANICNFYLVRSLTLIICSSERDGHLGQEVLSRSSDSSENNEGHKNNSSASFLSRKEDRRSFESFLSNVTHMMMVGGDENYRGEITAVAA